MRPVRQVRFDVRPFDDSPDPPRELVPVVDGVSLVDLVSAYEHVAGFDVPGQYAGLVVDRFRIGDVTDYLTGDTGATVALLGCDCGEVGCWPLEALVTADAAHVTWRGFAQPFRGQRDYSGFGPFTFRRAQYDSAVRRIVDLVS